MKRLTVKIPVKNHMTMKIFNNLVCTIAGAIMLPTSISMAQTESREILNPHFSDHPARVTVRRANTNASYKTTLVGFLYYADSWNDLEGVTPMGIYTIGTTPGSQPEQFARIGFMNSHCNGGAVLAGDTYWYIWRQTDPSGMTDIDMSQLYSYNITTGEFESYGAVSSELASNADKSWDPTEDRIYGQYTIDGKRKLCIVDYQEQTVTPVGDCYSYFGLAFDGTGQLWGIDSAGDLYKVDKRNGSANKIGFTGVIPRYAQSMAFDLKTNELYWASYTDAGKASSNLYKVDPADGRATLITAFGDQEEFMGLAVMPATAPDNAPGYATDLTVEMNGSTNTGQISFNLPQYTYMGNELDEDISYRVLANGNILFEGTGAKGQNVTRDITIPGGDVTISVICSNSEGDGPSLELRQWVGEDYPLAPEKVRLALDEASGKISLTWYPVTEGTHGGYINPENITYTVTRYPDAAEVANNITTNTFEETLEQPDLPTDFYYEVKSRHDWRESPEPAQSNHVPYGKGFMVPYFNDFNNESSLDLFYTIDGNGDGSTWKWSRFGTQTAYIFTGTDNAAPQNDWLITPGIEMKGGNRYEVTYVIEKNMNDGRFSDMLETAFGTGVDPTAYTVAENTFTCKVGSAETRTVVIEPALDGYYHFGFHAVSNCFTGLSINIDNLNIDVLANPGAPAPVTDLTVKSSQGTPPVNIRFKTPVQDNMGNNLASISKIDVFRNTNELVKSLEITEPGKQVTVIDSKGARGMTKYTVVAYNEYGIGERAEVEIFLGKDLPGAPRDITLTDEGDGVLKLSWKAPEEGANGGYCDPANLTYNIYTLVNNYYADFKKGLSQTEVTIQAEDYYSSEQTLSCFAVSAVNSVGEGNAYSSTEVILGRPYQYPFAESWAAGEARHDMWYRMNNGQNGWLPTANYSSDEDNGCMQFDAAEDGDMSYFCLGKVDLSTASNPKLIFDYYSMPGKNLILVPEINHAFTGMFTTLPAIDFTKETGEDEWREFVADLAQFKTLPYITVRFLGVGNTAYPLRVDNVRIMDSDKTPTYGGIDGILIDDEIEQYYDINGLPVKSPAKGSVIIVRSTSGKTFKSVVR